MNFIGTAKKLEAKDFEACAKSLKIPVATLKGVVAVEAAGSGFDAKNRPKILFEPHVFYARLKGNKSKLNSAVRRGLAYARWGAQPYPRTSEENYHRLIDAMQIDSDAALESASWGLAQIMGYNHASAGYASAEDMVTDFMKDEDNQLEAFCRLIDAWNLEDELQRRDAAGFALKYNGKGFKRNKYDQKLLAEWRRLDKIPATRLGFAAVPDDIDGGINPDHRLPGSASNYSSPVQEPGFGGEDPEKDTLFNDPAEVERLGTIDSQPATEDHPAVPPKEPEESDLVATSQSTDELKAKLEAKREGVTKEEVKPTSPIIQKADEVSQVADEGFAAMAKRKFWSIIAATGAGIVAALQAVYSALTEYWGEARNQVSPIIEFFGDIPNWLIFTGIAVLAVALGIIFHKEKNRLSEVAAKSAEISDRRFQMTKKGEAL